MLCWEGVLRRVVRVNQEPLRVKDLTNASRYILILPSLEVLNSLGCNLIAPVEECCVFPR